MTVIDRIPLQRSVAIVTEDSIVVRPGRGRLVVPLIQVALAGGAVTLIINLLNNNGPLWLLLVLLVSALMLGPMAVLGVVYNVVGSSVTIERQKQSVRLQQGFLGLGIGTAELVPFWRIDHIVVVTDDEDELTSGQRQDLVRWEVQLVKDNGRVLDLGAVVAPRAFAAEASERANRLAGAVATLTGVEAHTLDLPAEPPAEPPSPSPEAASEPDPERERAEAAPQRRRRVVRRRQRPPPPPPPVAGEAGLDRATELMREAKSIAVVGVSASPDRDSHRVAKYLIDAGYTVYLVNPQEDEVLGRTVYDRVADLPEAVDIVDVFRRAEHVPPVVEDAIEAGAKAVWMQLGIINEQAAERARAAGLEVVMDRCTKIEHGRLGDRTRRSAG